MSVAPGSYEIWLLPKGDYSTYVTMGLVTVPSDGTAEFEVSTAIRFAAEGSLPPLDHWQVLDSTGEVVARMIEKWGLAAVPPGSYRLEADMPEGKVRSGPKTVADGTVTTFTPADLGVARVDITLPSENELGFLFGGDTLHPLLALGDDVYELEVPTGSGSTGFWIKAQPIGVELAHGAFDLRTELDLQPGDVISLPFETEEVAAEQGLAILDFDNPESGKYDRIIMTAAAGSRALLSVPDFDFSKRYLVPASSVLSAMSEGVTTQHGPFLGGQTTRLDAGQLVTTDREPETVNIVIETPAAGAALPANTQDIEVIGDASAVGLAGTTKIALIVDVSASTGETSGADIDGDGRADSVLKAEVAAASALLDALSELESDSPGTAFSVALLAFGETAQVLAPLAPMTDFDAVATVRGSLNSLSRAMQGPDTFYDRGLDAARRLLDDATAPGPEVAILITDGKPSQIAPGLDAAARLGNAGIALHSIGLGPDFRSARPPPLRYPPLPNSGSEILASLSAFGVEGGKVWFLPDPADVINIVAELPVLENVDAGIHQVTVTNETTSEAASHVTLGDGGSFSATVPIRFDPDVGIVANLITARAFSNESEHGAKRDATAQVHVVVEGGSTTVAERRDAERDAPERQVAALSTEAVERALDAEGVRAELDRLREEMEAAAAAAARALDDQNAEAHAKETALTEERNALEEQVATLSREAEEANAEVERLREELESEVAAADSALEEQSADAAARVATLGEERDAERDRRIAAEVHLAEAEDALRDAQRSRDEASELEAAVRDRNSCRVEVGQCRTDLSAAMDAAIPSQTTPDSVLLSVPGDVLFDFGEWDIREDAKATLELVALYIRENKRSDIIVEGHTDGIGSSEDNRTLSLRRAAAVRSWLIDSGAVTREQARTVGHGEEKPVAEERLPDGSDDPSARQKNRRVEIRLLQ